MLITNVYEAKAILSALINKALAGEEVYISKADEPKVKLVPIHKHIYNRTPGAWKGKVDIAPDFDILPKKLLAAFQGKDALSS